MLVYHIVHVFDDKCWKCEENIKLAFIETIPFVLREVGDEGLELIKDKKYATVKKVYRRTLGREVWGNVCPNCEAYQGNWFLFSKWADAYYTNQTKIVDAIQQEVQKERCQLCGRKVARLVTHRINYETPETVDICQQCHTRICKGSRFWDFQIGECPLCGRVPAKLVTHHINYDPPETIDICQQCHIKIHKRQGFLDYKEAEGS
jgi:protein-arginine kinase activator protein McsA